jgi:hypothetical protein
MTALDQSFYIDFPLTNFVHDETPPGGTSDSGFADTSAPFVDCDRDSNFDGGQGVETDGNSG